MRGRALVMVENQETESHTGAGAFGDHLGCPGGAIQTIACGRGGGTYKSAAVAGMRGTAESSGLSSDHWVRPAAGHGVSERC